MRLFDELDAADELLKDLRVVDLGAGEYHLERDTIPVEDEVALGSGVSYL